jgi:hypothetical protein
MQSLSITIINYESLHKITDRDFDTVILDEAHSMGAFPKPSKRAKQVKEILSKHIIQKLFYFQVHQLPNHIVRCIIRYMVYKNNPFKDYVNFYKFSKKICKCEAKKNKWSLH